MGWLIVDDFGEDTAGGAKCFLLGTIKRKDDPGVFRSDSLPGEGFIDFSCSAIEDAAGMLGWASPAKLQAMQQQVEQAEEVSEDLRAQLRILRGVEELLAEAVERFPAIAAEHAKAPAKKAAKKA